MTSPDSIPQRGSFCSGLWRAAVTVGLLMVMAGAAWAASGGDAAHGGLTSTDWYRIMNFVVLAAALVFLLRKPIPRALNSRMQGIQDQLKDLEARKADAPLMKLPLRRRTEDFAIEIISQSIVAGRCGMDTPSLADEI